MRARLAKLETAHRALAAQHTALFEIFRAVLPLVPASGATIQSALFNVRTYCDAQMLEAEMDGEYSGMVAKWIEALTAAVLQQRQTQPQPDPLFAASSLGPDRTHPVEQASETSAVALGSRSHATARQRPS